MEEKGQLDEISTRHKQLQSEYNVFVEERAKNRPDSSSSHDGVVEVNLEEESNVVLDDDTVAAGASPRTAAGNAWERSGSANSGVGRADAE